MHAHWYDAVIFKDTLRMLGIALALLMIQGSPARAQTFFLDTNGDGKCGQLEIQNGNNGVPWDCLQASTTSVDVYFVTNQNPDFSAATCATSDSALTISSYEAALRWLGAGTVVAQSWTDNMGFTTPLITKGDGTFASVGQDIWVGRGGSPLPPGKYKVGTLSVAVTGNPYMVFVTSAVIDVNAETGFGSACGGELVQDELLLGADFPPANAFGTCQPDDVVPVTWGKIKQRYR